MLLYLMSFVNLYVFNLEIAEWMCVIIIIIYSPSMRVKYTTVCLIQKKKFKTLKQIFFSLLKFGFTSSTREDGTRVVIFFKKLLWLSWYYYYHFFFREIGFTKFTILLVPSIHSSKSMASKSWGCSHLLWGRGPLQSGRPICNRRHWGRRGCNWGRSMTGNMTVIFRRSWWCCGWGTFRSCTTLKCWGWARQWIMLWLM